MTVEEALAAVRAAEGQGKQEDAVRQELLASGVPAEIVDAAMAAAKGEAQAAPQLAADAPSEAGARAVQPRSQDTVIVRPTMPGWLLSAFTVLLAISYVTTFSRHSGPDWTVQFFTVLLTWLWIWKNDGRIGLLGGVILAAVTAGGIFLAGVRMMTVGFAGALAYAIFGGRWPEGAAKAFIVVVNVAFLAWFLYGLGHMEARQPFL